MLQAKYVNLEIFSKLIISGSGSCEFGKINENRFENGVEFLVGYFLSLHRDKDVCQVLQFHCLPRDQDIYKELDGLPSFARDFYCQLCLYVSSFLCLSISLYLCISVTLYLCISPLSLYLSQT